MGRRFGANGKVMRGVRIGASLTEAEGREYDRLLSGLTDTEWRWIHAQCGPPCARPA